MFAFESVYLARHGQTVWNLEGRRQGRLDSPLTPEGVLQVGRNAAAVRCEPVDALFSSPLERARTSAAVFAAALGMPVQVLDEVRPALGTIEVLAPSLDECLGVSPPGSYGRS